jgi:hypothetical protein
MPPKLLPRSQSVLLPRVGQFAKIYKQVKHDKKFKDITPIVFCEGDSWFSTPLSMNLLDWLVYAPPELEEKGVPVLGAGGLFFRAEESGYHASANAKNPKASMFVPNNIKKLSGWYEKYEFDIVLLSAGGNDFVADFLEKTFKGMKDPISVEKAMREVNRSGKWKVVYEAYQAFVGKFLEIRPDVPILAHSYDYPRLLGKKADFTVANLGAAAIFAKGTGPWIGDRISLVLPDPKDQREFAKQMIDGFTDNVLAPVKKKFEKKGTFDYVDLRGMLKKDTDWFDEMHPTGEGFRTLAEVVRARVGDLLPAGKAMGIIPN